jgi:hypothetical protein
VITRGSRERWRYFRYGCGQHLGRGATVCGNGRLATLDLVDAEIRTLLATEVLNPQRIEAALDKAIAMVRTRARAGPDPTHQKKRLHDVERVLANLTETAAKGGAVPAVVEALNRADAERRALLRELDAAKVSRTEYACPDARTLRRTPRGYLDEWHALIRGNVTEARGLLTVVLRDRITFTPRIGSNGDPIYELTIPIAFDRLLVSVVPGLQSRVGLVDAGGIEPPTS